MGTIENVVRPTMYSVFLLLICLVLSPRERYGGLYFDPLSSRAVFIDELRWIHSTHNKTQVESVFSFSLQKTSLDGDALLSHQAHFRQHHENEVEHFSSSALKNHCIIHHVGTIFLAQWRSRRRSASERLEFLMAYLSHHHDAVVEELYHDLTHRLRFTAFGQCS